MDMLKLLTIVFSFSSFWSRSSARKLNDDQDILRAQRLVAQMTIDEKISLVHGSGSDYVGSTVSIPRLSIPSLHLEDGPQGVADGVTEVTQWPSTLTVVSSWDRQLMKSFAAGMAREQILKGSNVLLGPMVNLARVPTGGRNFESVGEDPYLASQMAIANVQGIQNLPIIACVKHYLDNNQEFNRTGVSVKVDERTQRELYFPAFQAAIEAGVGSVMCSYNRVNDVYACENDWMNKHLKEELAFTGWIMSDWGATHSTVQAANAGLDQQMPDASFFGEALKKAITDGTVSESRLDDMVTRILTSMYKFNIMGSDTRPSGSINNNATSLEHSLLSRTLAEHSTVLLKNEGNLLPLDNTKFTKYAVIGDQITTAGGGSGGVIPSYIITPFQGISARAAKRPSTCTFEVDIDYYQPLNPSVNTGSEQECCQACSAISTCTHFTFVPADNKCYLKSSNDGRISKQGVISGSCFNLTSPVVTYTSLSNATAVLEAVQNADVAIVVIATSSSEGVDRLSLGLDSDTESLISSILKVQPRSIMVVRSPGALTMPWADSANAILLQMMPGQEAGNALASVLFGDVNPSGRLPLTFPNSMSETWLQTADQYPGINGESVYSEGLLMGYRWYNAKNIKPLFPFGYGLSYTTFQYDAPSIDVSNNIVTITVNVMNIGEYNGAEIVELYLSFPSNVNEPVKQLKGFEKVFLNKQESAIVYFELSVRDTSIFNTTTSSWEQVKGLYNVFLGSTSLDIKTSAFFTL